MSLNPSLGKLLVDYIQSGDPDNKSIEDKIWKKHGHKGAIFILDMAGFSRTTVSHGLIYYLAMVKRMNSLVEPLISQFNGTLVKFDADNAFAFFETVEDALEAAIQLNQILREENRKTPDLLDILVSIGIDYGEFIYLKDENDYYGNPVNFACKLGEDIGIANEILITEDAWKLLPENRYSGELKAYQISGIAFKAYKVNY